MKTKNITFLVTALTLFVLTVIGSFVMSRSATAQKDIQPQNLIAQPKTTNFLKNERNINQDVPDKIAYELFLRTVGEYNAKNLVEKAGFSENEVELIVGEAKSLNETLVLNDESARKIRESKDNLSASDYKSELAKVQTKEDELIERTVNDHLFKNLNAGSAGKLKDFIDSEVKNNITVVNKTESEKDKSAPVKTPVEDSLQNRGKIYLYSAIWQSGIDIFGSGTLSEQFQSSASYHVTTTVTSPSGRSNTTDGDWGYATISNNTGLSLGVEDGHFIVQASFEQADGYYDEYGNFVATGATNLGSSTNFLDVPATVSLVAVSVNPATIGGLATANLLATVSYSQSLPNNSTIEMELNDSITSSTQPTYTVGQPTAVGGVPVNGNNRRISLTAPAMSGENPRSQQVTFPITTTQTTAGGTVNLSVRIGNLQVPAPAPSPAPTIVAPLNRDATLTITAASPTPTPGGGGGSGGGQPVSCYPTGGGGGFGCNAGYYFGFIPGGSGGQCCPYSSPLLLDIDGNGYAMTDYYEGVPFDVSGKGYATQTSWTAANSDDAWIVLDRNENNRIDSGVEMFGDGSEQDAAQNPRNGFASLAVFDTAARGGNADGKITRRDAVFRKLRLWQDRNHNGISEPEELSRLPALDVVAVFLNYRQSNRTDQYGNRFKFRAKVRDKNDARVGRWAWDVFLIISPPNGENRPVCLLRK